GVLHRDIKPSNLILDTTGTVWVTDFGLAKHEDDSLTHTGDIVGTLRYMAPERFAGQADRRSDVYSLGLTLYELCTLRHAFANVDRAALIQQVSTQSPIPPRQLDSQIPRDLETIILKATDSQPDRRYQSAKKLADDLRLYLRDRPIGARRISLWRRLVRVCRRNPLPTILAGCLAILLAVLIVGSVWFGYVSRQEAKRSQQAKGEALAAKTETLERTFELHLKTAEALRWSGRPGQNVEGLASIREATQLIPLLDRTPEEFEQDTLRLRDAAVAAMVLPELEEQHLANFEAPWTSSVVFDYHRQRFAQSDLSGNVRIRSFHEKTPTQVLPGQGERAWRMRFSRDGRYLACKHHALGAAANIDILVWDLDHPEKPVLAILDHDSVDLDFDFASGKPHFAFATPSRGINIYSLESGEVLKNIPSEFKTSAVIQYSGDNHLGVAHMFGKKVEIWSLEPEPKLIESTQIEASATAVCWDYERAVFHVGTNEGWVCVWRGGLKSQPKKLE
ncbi:MAG: protein kinase, partial [Planctomycetaceae bacterium]|nr:protein kinase [Planctomycetaceae bacterium]